MANVEGIGGVFVDSRDARALAGWYRRHLGVEFEEHPDGESYYFVFRTRDLTTSAVRENPVFAINQTEGPLAPAEERGFVVNLRVGDFEATLESLRHDGVQVEDRTVEWEGGKHGWTRDLDGNRIELYEELTLPPDSHYRSG